MEKGCRPKGGGTGRRGVRVGTTIKVVQLGIYYHKVKVKE